MMSILLIVLAGGWTVTYQDIDIDDSFEIYLPVGALIIMLHIVISALTFVDIDASHKYHDFAGIQGWVLFAIKIVIWTYFMFRHQQTKKTIEARQQSYFQILLVMGSAFMLAVPMSITTTVMFSPYERQYVFNMLSHFMMFGTNVLLLF